MIDLRLLGTVDLRRDDGGTIQSVVVQPKRMALLAYLAAATPRGPHRRDILLGLLWPDLDAERGRGALSKALHHLRGSLGAEALVNRGEEAVELDGDRVRSDVARFEEALAAGELEAALDLYGGELLHGFFLSDAREFERWVDGERTRLRERASGAAGELAERSRAAGELARGGVGTARAGAGGNPRAGGAPPDGPPGRSRGPGRGASVPTTTSSPASRAEPGGGPVPGDAGAGGGDAG
jgi:DNA-binding SARP family transcriptional activator